MAVTGYIYKRTLKADGGEKGFTYIGETMDTEKRNYTFKNPNQRYSGKKIETARKTYGTGDDVWEYEILEEVTRDNIKKLMVKLRAKETYYIKLYNSIDKGFNIRTKNGWKHDNDTKRKIGMSNRLKSHKIGIIVKNENDGSEQFFESTIACSNKLGINNGSVSYYRKKKRLYKGTYSFRLAS